MIQKVRAKYANGVLTPLEPLELEEGAEVVLSVESDAPLDPQQKSEKTKFRVNPNHSGFLPGMDDPKKMKQLLEDEDNEHFLRVQEFGKGT
jgi:predicted DNA-binding antitoxin AbrB/MazE fold protein